MKSQLKNILPQTEKCEGFWILPPSPQVLYLTGSCRETQLHQHYALTWIPVSRTSHGQHANMLFQKYQNMYVYFAYSNYHIAKT